MLRKALIVIGVIGVVIGVNLLLFGPVYEMVNVIQ